MNEKVKEILTALKKVKIPTSKIESDLGFSNGLLSKEGLSQEKFDKLCEYYDKHLKGEDGVVHCYTVYKLLDENDCTFYVGVTRQQLQARLANHVSDSGETPYQKPSKKQAKIADMINRGYYPKIEPLEIIKNKSLILLFEEVIERENYWIDKFVNDGCDLCNNKALVSKIKRGGSAVRQYPVTALPPNYLKHIIALSKSTHTGLNKAQGGTQIQNLNKPTGTKEVPVNEPKINETINTMPKHRLWKEDDPKENTIAFARKYNDAWNYDELEKQLKNK